MSHDNSSRMLALCLAHLRQRLQDDLGLDSMLESGNLTIKVKQGGLFSRNESDSFRQDLRTRIREVQELVERASFSVSDEALVEAWEHNNGVGADAKLLWAEIRHRGLVD